MNIVCSECGEPAGVDSVCPCGGLPEFAPPCIRMSPEGFRHTVRQRRSSYDPLFSSGVWRYAELLPPIPREHIVSLGEGNMPVYEAVQGAKYAGIDRLSYLHLGMNPTGSFKDLGMTVAVSAAKAAGAPGVACASTGNTAASMAAYASRAGLAAYALVPQGKISRAKLAQMHDYGARIVEIEGSFDEAFEQLGALKNAPAIVNSVNPYRLEGQKCALFALLEARAWRVPDWIVLPGGNLGNVSAIGKGLREALALGLIASMPRIAVVQASGAAPFADVWRSRGELVPVARPQTSASAIAIGSPKSWRRALQILDDTHGMALAIDDAEIDAAKRCIGVEGIGCEPASAAALAGARMLRHAGIIDAGADVVAILTGHVLKDSAASERLAHA